MDITYLTILASKHYPNLLRLYIHFHCRDIGCDSKFIALGNPYSSFLETLSGKKWQILGHVYQISLSLT